MELYNGRVDELNSVTQERDDTRKQYDELRKRRYSTPLVFFVYIFVSLLLLFHEANLHFDDYEFISGWMSLWQGLTLYP